MVKRSLRSFHFKNGRKNDKPPSAALTDQFCIRIAHTSTSSGGKHGKAQSFG